MQLGWPETTEKARSLVSKHQTRGFERFRVLGSFQGSLGSVVLGGWSLGFRVGKGLYVPKVKSLSGILALSHP